MTQPDPTRPTGHEVRDRLVELGLDLHRIWRHTPDELWGRLDPELWDLTHNRWVVLQTVSQARIDQLAADADFRAHLDRLWDEHRAYRDRECWFATEHPGESLRVAYFSMEFMLSESLPIYSGGLGNVAGDQLKAASDLGVPVIGVGLLYQQGYFRQVIDPEGNQRALYPYNDPFQLPIAPVRDAEGEWVRVTVPFAGSPVRARAWEVRVGRNVLYLLDTNVPSNRPAVRGITSELYGGGPEDRLAQEILLGIGGWRLLRALGLSPEVCHLNEGHAAFAVLERARDVAEATGLTFEEALTTTRAGNLFTTHTPVDAGFDRFDADLVRRYLGRYIADEVGVDVEDVLALGRGPGDPSTFNMAFLAVRASGAVNGVSSLHARVSRRLFAPLFPRWPIDEVPVSSVTNGIHVPTWDDSRADELWQRVGGIEGLRDGRGDAAEGLREVPDSELWEMRSAARAGLVRFVRTRYARQLSDSGVSEAEAGARADMLFDPNVLTLAFARRFAPYKRPNLMLSDPDRLARLISDQARPVQVVVAGKAHPADRHGQAMVREWVEFSRRPDVDGSVVFLADYDMLLTRQLVQGVDVWVNTPRRPWEASGTSGMKVLANGGLNLSVLDGWWAEAYEPGRGWCIGNGSDHVDDEAEAVQLYELLESEIIPMFYDRDEHGVPLRWVATMRESMVTLTPRFSADRTVREYAEQHYLPLAAGYRRRVADDAHLGRELAAWRTDVARSMRRVHATAAKVVDSDDATARVELQAYLDGLDPSAVRVELYADPPRPGEAPTVVEMKAVERLVGSEGGYRFEAALPEQRPFDHFTARIVPHHPDVGVPLEVADIAWV